MDRSEVEKIVYQIIEDVVEREYTHDEEMLGHTPNKISIDLGFDGSMYEAIEKRFGILLDYNEHFSCMSSDEEYIDHIYSLLGEDMEKEIIRRANIPPRPLPLGCHILLFIFLFGHTILFVGEADFISNEVAFAILGVSLIIYIVWWQREKSQQRRSLGTVSPYHQKILIAYRKRRDEVAYGST